MNLVIQKATLSDIELLMEWRMEVLHEVFSIPDNQSMELLKKANRQYYEKALGTDSHIACFAWLDSTIAGCGGICLYNEMPSPDNPQGKCAYLMNIYTRPQFRKQGVGNAVISWLTEQAVQQGISKIYLETSKAGKSMYQKYGFEPMPDMLRLPTSKITR